MRAAREFISAYAWQIATLLFLSGMAYAALQQKADKTELMILKQKNDSAHALINTELANIGKGVMQTQETILYLICKDHPLDSACRGKETKK